MTNKHKQLLIPTFRSEDGLPSTISRDLFYAHRHSTKVVLLDNLTNKPIQKGFDAGAEGFKEVLHKDRLLATLAWVVNEMPGMGDVQVKHGGVPQVDEHEAPIFRRDDSLDQVVCAIARVSSLDQPRRDLGRLLAETRLLAFLTPVSLRNKGQARLMTKTRSGYIEDKLPRQALRDFHIVQMNKIKFIEQFLHQNPFKVSK